MAQERDSSWEEEPPVSVDTYGSSVAEPFYRFHTTPEEEKQAKLDQELCDLLGLLSIRTYSETNKISLEERIGDARLVSDSTYYNAIGKQLAEFYSFFTSVKDGLITDFNSVGHYEQDTESKSSLDRDPEPEQEPDPNRWFDFDNLYYICLEYLILRGFTMDLAHLLILNEIFGCTELSKPIFRRQQYYLEKDCEKIVFWDSSLKTQQAYGCDSALNGDYYCAIEAIKKLYSTIVELNSLSGGGGGGGVGVAVAEEEV